MASITVTQNCYWGGSEYNWAGLVFGDSVTVNNGAVLTIDPAVYTPTGIDIGVRIISTAGFGEVVFDNNSSTALRHYGPYAQTMQIESGSKVTVKKHYFTIYAGDGTASQTTTGWTAIAGYNVLDIPTMVEVETGNGTNVWNKFINIDTLAFSDVGLNVLGKWFKYNSTTGVITFGDGGNALAGHGGDVVPNGARVRVYSTLWGTKSNATTIQNYAAATDNYELDVANGGSTDLSGLNLSGFYLNFRSPLNTTINGVASYTPIYGEYAGGCYINELFICVNASTTSTVIVTLQYNIPNIQMTNCVFAMSDQANLIYLNNVVDSTIENCEFYVLKRNSANDVAISISTCNNIQFKDIKVVGGRFNADVIKNVSIDGIGLSDSPHSGVYGNYYGSLIQNAGDVGIGLNNAYLINDGNVPDSSISQLIQGCNIIKNSSVECLGTQFCSITADGLQLKNVYIGSVSTYHVGWTGPRSNILLQNVRSNGFNLPLLRGTGYTPANIIFKAVDISPTGIGTNPGWTQNTHFYEVRTSTNGGLIGLLFTAYTSDYQYISVNGRVVFNMAGSMYMPGAQNDSITFTWPHKIIGVTGLLGVLTLGGSGTQYFTVEYSLDNGNTWLAVNATNMTAEAVSPSSGFALKIRITHTRVSSADYLNLLNFTTTVDYINYKYPIDEVDIVLQNVKDGTRYTVDNVTLSTNIATGTKSGSGDVVISSVPYNGSDETLLIKCRKSSSAPKYKAFKTNAILTSSGATVYVNQELDTIA